jgi:hypothetical protein
MDAGADGLPSVLFGLNRSPAFQGTRHRRASSFPVEKWLVGLNHRHADDRRPQGCRTDGWPEYVIERAPVFGAENPERAAGSEYAFGQS